MAIEIALIDHYDSFTFNVLDWLVTGPEGVQVHYIACDDLNSLSVLSRSAVIRLPLVISPGPKRPQDAPNTLELLQNSLGSVPILGVCLGHQMLAHIAGAPIIRAKEPFHGSTRKIRPDSVVSGLFAGCPESFQAATYNSLIVAHGSFTAPWRVTATCEQNEIQAIAYEDSGKQPAYGVQFHPESFLSEAKDILRANWLGVVMRYYSSAKAPLSMPS